MPVVGLGTWRLKGDEGRAAIAYALSIGYVHLDTADVYDNHREVAAAIRQSGVAREDIFITTKIWNTSHSREKVLQDAERFLKELDTEYIDLLLIHWPISEVPVEETLRAMAELKTTGKVRAIGVANFTERHIEDALTSGIDIVNNQVEVRPTFTQKALREFCMSKRIAVTAHSLLRGGDLELPHVVELARRYVKTPAQVIINWVVSRGMIAIPKSAQLGHIKENLESLDFAMSEEDLKTIEATPQGVRAIRPAWNEF